MNSQIAIYNTELFFELSSDLFFIAGYDGYWKKINKAVCNLLGYTEEELLSKPLINFLHKEDVEITLKNREFIKKGNPLMNFENRYVTKTGEIVWLFWTAMPHDETKLIYAVAKDITHKKKVEEERDRLLTNLKIINARLKKLSYTASHDIRSPVNNVLSVFDLLDLSKIEDDETLEFVQMIKVASNGLKDTLNNYVENIKQSEINHQNIELLNFESSLKTITKSIRSLILSSKTIIDTDFDEMQTISFNRVFLESIFLNLITNSIKYARIGESPVIKISSQHKDGINILIYTDNGQGFDLENNGDKIFGLNQIFHNTPDSNGIGLYLVYNHIQEMGGTIAIESEINKGTTFTIRFKN